MHEVARQDQELCDALRAFALQHEVVIAQGGPHGGLIEVKYATARCQYIARKAAPAYRNHLTVEGLYGAIRALIRVALAEGSVHERHLACNADAAGNEAEADADEDDVEPGEPSAKALKRAVGKLTNAVWRGNVNDPRLPASIRGQALRDLLPSFGVAPGRTLGYYLVQLEHARAGYESLLRVLDEVRALAPPDSFVPGPKRFPEKASLIVGHFLRIDGKGIRDTFQSTDEFKALFGAGRAQDVCPVNGWRQKALFNMVFDMSKPALRDHPSKGPVTSLDTDG